MFFVFGLSHLECLEPSSYGDILSLVPLHTLTQANAHAGTHIKRTHTREHEAHIPLAMRARMHACTHKHTHSSNFVGFSHKLIGRSEDSSPDV